MSPSQLPASAEPGCSPTAFTPPANVQPELPRRTSPRAGFSLIELVCGMFILATVAIGTTSALIQGRKLSESNLVQAFAEVTAQSIIEQLVAQPYAVLTAPTDEVPGMTIKLPGLDPFNRTTIEDFELPWATSDSDFTNLGTPEDPDRGILMDVAYVRESNTIHPERYLQMRLCLLREISESSTDRRVFLTLRYQWAAPDRRGNGNNPVYLSGEFRTVRSSASSF